MSEILSQNEIEALMRVDEVLLGVITNCGDSNRKYKCITQPPEVARRLLKLGNQIVDVKPMARDNDKYKNASAFVFEITPKLMYDYKAVTGRSLRVND